jgi:hypothetical protein
MIGMFTSAAARSAGGWMGARAVAGGLAGAVIGGDDSSMFKGALLGAMGPGVGGLKRGATMAVGKMAQGGIPLVSGMAKSGHMGRRILGAGLLGGAAKATYGITHGDNIREFQESRYGAGAATDARLAGTRMAGTAGAVLLGTAAVGMGLGMYKGPLNVAKGGMNAVGGAWGAAGRGLAGGRNFGRGLVGMRDVGASQVRGVTDIFEASSRGHHAGSSLRRGVGKMMVGRIEMQAAAFETVAQGSINAVGGTIRGAGAVRKAGASAFASLGKVTANLDGATWTGPRKIALRAQGAMRGLRGQGMGSAAGEYGASARGQWGAFQGKAGAPRVGAARRRVTGAVRPELEMGYGFGLQARGAVINAGIKGGEIAQGLTNHAQRWKYGVTQAAGRAVGGIGPAVGNMGGSAVSGGKSILGTPGNVGKFGRVGPEIQPSGLRGSHFNPERSPYLYTAAGGVAAGLMLGGTDAARRKRGKNMPEGFITAMNSAPRGGIHPALNFATQGLTLRTHNRRKRRVLD